MMRIVSLLTAAALLSGCGVGRGHVQRDIDRVHPGCKLEKIQSTRNLNGDDRYVLAKFTYSCPADNYLKYGNWVYTKSMDTGFTIYCCMREATAEEL